jgi:perosamine synthetase
MNRELRVSDPMVYLSDYVSVNRALWKRQFSGSSYVVRELEDALRDKHRVGHAIAVSNGTVALQSLLHALEVKPGQKVIVPNVSFVAVANVLRSFGLEVLAVDVNLDDWQLNPDLLRTVDEDNLVGIILTHNYGGVADVDKVSSFATERGLWLIGDSAESHGATLKEQSVESLTKMTATSFYANKIVTGGEGGAVYCENPDLASKIRHLISHAQIGKGSMRHDSVGFNYRMSGLACALAKSSLRRMDKSIKIRKEQDSLYKHYLRSLFESEDLVFRGDKEGVESVNWLFSITLPNVDTELGSYDFFKQRGIETRLLFSPLDTMEYLQAKAFTSELNNAHYLRKHGLSLPTSVNLRESDIKYVAKTVHSFVNEFRRR